MTRPVNLRPRRGGPRDPDGVLRISFPAPCVTLNLNDRLHHWKRAERVALWRRAARFAAYGTPKNGPSNVRLVIGVPYPGRRRDPHNWMPTVKAVIDGLVDAGIWPDDNSDHVTVIEPAFRKGTDCIIEIWPRTHQRKEHP